MKSLFTVMVFAMSSINAFTVPETSRISTAIFSEAPAATPTENNQPKYGKDLDLPGTYVRCGRCATSYAIAATDLGTGKGR